MAWSMQQHTYYVELICVGFFFLLTRDKRNDRRQLEVAFAEGLSSEFKCSDKILPLSS